MATIRKWLSDKGVTHIQFPSVRYEESDDVEFGLDAWADVPVGVFEWTDPRIQVWLDLSFDTGFGTARVPYYTAWSPTHVHYVHEYDGATSPHYVERNPNLETR